MTQEFTFRIAGSYSPDDIPLERLGEYLVALGELFGNQANVHFRAIEAGSTVVRAAIDHAAAPKVASRVRALSVGDATADTLRAYKRLDTMLLDDNATGELVGNGDNVIHVDFPGTTRPRPVAYGPVRQAGVIDGEIFRVEGRDATIHVGVMDGQRTYSLEAPASYAHQLAQLFRAGPIRFRGEGSWLRHGDGTWELRKFRIEAVETLDSTSLSEAIEDLRHIGLGGWADVDDPASLLAAERNEKGSAH